MSQLIRKEGKARWVYRCDFCRLELVEVDQLRILEARNRHVQGSLTHVRNVVTEAVKPALEFLNNLALAAESFQKALLSTPPPNRPHDPRLLKDRRGWGGR